MEKFCTVLLHDADSEPPSVQTLAKTLETGTEDEKADALKKLITFHANGEALPKLIMSVIRFVLPSKNHTLKKLCLLYWEVLDMKDDEGKLKPEIILAV